VQEYPWEMCYKILPQEEKLLKHFEEYKEIKEEHSRMRFCSTCKENLKALKVF